MAQQTINIGASPNDGTGTPLRTAFQYTNSNFSELYTAVGPSGNNIVVPGSATITGDLTVDTSTLKVDSANDRVGVGITSPLAKVDIRQSAAVEALKVYLNDNGSTNIVNFRSFDNVGGEVTRFAIAANGVATWSYVGGVAGTAMTLNATGLGVGASPAAKLHVLDASLSGTTAGSNVIATLRSNGSGYDSFLQFSDSVSYNAGVGMLAGNLYFYTSGAERARIDTSGNVGIGVTPSAWLSTFKSLQVGGYGVISNSPGNDLVIGNNWYNDTSDKRINAGYASRMFFGQSANGGFSWQLAGTSTAGSTISWTTAMQLDANGNLILQSSATPATLTTNGQLTVNATSNTNLRFSYRGSDGVTRVADLTLA